MTINISLHKDRTSLGTLTCGSLMAPCLALSDNTAAVAAGNPQHDPLKTDGDLPTGTYACQVIAAGLPQHSYGPHGRLLLTGLTGDALAVVGVRFGLMVHGGDLNPAYTWWQGLRPTHGCLRLKDEDMAALLALLSGEVTMVVGEI